MSRSLTFGSPVLLAGFLVCAGCPNSTTTVPPSPTTPSCSIQLQNTQILTNPPTPNQTPTLVALTSGFAKNVTLTYAWAVAIPQGGTVTGSGKTVTYNLAQLPSRWDATDITLKVTADNGTSASCLTTVTRKD